MNSSIPIFKAEWTKSKCNLIRYSQLKFDNKLIDTSDSGDNKSLWAPVNGVYYKDLNFSTGSIAKSFGFFARVMDNERNAFGMAHYGFRRRFSDALSKSGLIKLNAGNLVIITFRDCVTGHESIRSSLIIYLQSKNQLWRKNF